MEENILLKTENLSFAYQTGEPILQDINLTICYGDYLVIIGPNGGGKTTLLKLILGLLKPTQGKVTFNPLFTESKMKIGYVPQIMLFDRAFPIRVIEVVVMGFIGERGLGRFYSKNDYKLAEKALEIVQMLEYKDNHINELSGGQLQRVLIARSLLTKPTFLLLDEPTTFIDKDTQNRLTRYLVEWNSKMTIVVVTHDMGIVSNWAKQIACINKKLYYHGGSELPFDVLEETYECPIDMIAHGVPHRVLREHD